MEPLAFPRGGVPLPSLAPDAPLLLIDVHAESYMCLFLHFFINFWWQKSNPLDFKGREIS
jgi:hypothetical protein